MWPRDAFVGQRVVGLYDLPVLSNGASLTRGKVYVVLSILPDERAVYFELDGNAANAKTRFNAVKPVDESRLDVFRAMLKKKGAWYHAKDKIMDGQDA